MPLVTQVHAILLAGGYSFGLNAATSVMRYLEVHNINIETGLARVPILPAAVTYDLGLGNPKIQPDVQMGYLACLNASPHRPAEGVLVPVPEPLLASF
jgi:L-aminopeptidase/D-esterase-like protein